MKLTMKNIGVIRDAEIELDGITVLAGYNGTGKSTTSKALYGVIASYVNLEEKILEERTNSVLLIVMDFLMRAAKTLSIDRKLLNHITQVTSDFVTGACPIPEQYEDWVRLLPEYLKNGDSESFPKFLEKLRTAVNRSNTEYVQYLADKTMKSVFDSQINTIHSPEPGEVSLTGTKNTRLAWMKITGNAITECSVQEIHVRKPIYLDTRHVLDRFSEPAYNSDLYTLLKESASEPTFEEYKSREHVQELIASVIHGRLTTSSFGNFTFTDDHFNEPVSLRNIASGNKTFAVLQRLIQNGALRENTVLIIDEPENNQHPEWQLKLAETLVLLHKELGVRLFLNTHSTYFLRAIEVYADKYELSDHCHYYQTQPADGAENLFYVRNVDGNTNLIYHDFYMPLEEL
ncbi:MAG: AAA family ATPase [Oscillibacter sp.]|nr:AAA family ATPase [Oscillibacter sp.]